MLSISITILESMFPISLLQVFLDMNLQQYINLNTIIISLLLSNASKEDLSIDPLLLQLVNHMDSIVRIQEIIRRSFELNDINRFKAAILFPYAMLSYYIADLITTAIPLFVPSPRMMARENIGFDAMNNDIQYCWTRANELPRHPNTTHPYSPEDRSIRVVEYWTQYASFYIPCSIQFNDYNHLARLMRTTNYSSVFECNLQYRETIKQHNDRVWKQLFPKIQRNRRFPDSIADSLEWFNETTFFF